MAKAFLIMMISLVFCIQTETNAADSTLIDFKIKDQFKILRTNTDIEDKVLIIIGSNKAGNKFNKIWEKELRDSLKNTDYYERILSFGVPDFRGVPFFIKGSIRRKLAKDSTNNILMDWKGKFVKAYEYVEGKSNILIFDTDGQLRSKTAVTEMEYTELNKILQLIKNICSSDVAIRKKDNP